MAPITGTPNNDTLLGTSGPDTIFGGNGQDLIRGFADDDSLDGGEGNDTVDAGSGGDTVIGGGGQDLLTGDNGDDRMYGGAGDDRILAGQGDDLAEGGEGQDSIEGGEGEDSLQGGAGDDRLFGGQGDDDLDGGEGNDRLLGGQGGDLLAGGGGDDVLEGEQGADTIAGGAGNDQMFGGHDNDVFLAVGGGEDWVYGGSNGRDFDELRMGGIRHWQILEQRPDSDGNGYDGLIGIYDASGAITGRIEFRNIENIICFTAGCRIATPRGEVPVETLRPGDRVVTRDNGLQELRWIGGRSLTWQELAAAPHLRPIRITQGSLGQGLPERDMLVSPNHRMLVASSRSALYFAEAEVLVAAKHLVDHRAIRPVEPFAVTYVHLLFDRHEVVLADGAWSESFQPGDWSLNGIGNAQRLEIVELFPALATAAGRAAFAAARPTLKRAEAALLAR